jgi:hypothetical protein
MKEIKIQQEEPEEQEDPGAGESEQPEEGE